MNEDLENIKKQQLSEEQSLRKSISLSQTLTRTLTERAKREKQNANTLREGANILREITKEYTKLQNTVDKRYTSESSFMSINIKSPYFLEALLLYELFLGNGIVVLPLTDRKSVV